MTFEYDVLGRVFRKVEPEGITTTTYDTAVKGIGKVASVTHYTGCVDTVSYDALGRTAATTRTYDGRSYGFSTGYDSLSRPLTTTYPSGFTTRNFYNANGALTNVTDGAGSFSYWSVNPTDIHAAGHVLREQFGNGVTTASNYDPAKGELLGLQTSTGAAVLQNNGYTYDPLGNLLSRSDGVAGRSESFRYDALNRLERARSMACRRRRSPTLPMATSCQRQVSALTPTGRMGRGRTPSPPWPARARPAMPTMPMAT